jgi:capsular exopolysaccharide synthesis family protein
MISTLRDHDGWGSQGVADLGSTVRVDAEASPVPPLLTVLLRRWRAVGLTLLTCLVIGGVYLALAPRVYRSSATVHVLQGGERVLGEQVSAQMRSDGFVGSQASVLHSTPVLTRALSEIGRDKMKTFDEVHGDPVAWLQAPGRLNVEVTDKADLIVTTMDSKYPQEAAAIVNGVMTAYLHELAFRRRAAGDETVKILQAERAQLQAKLDKATQAIVKSQQDAGVLSLHTNDNGNSALQRVQRLNEELSAAEMSVVQLRAQQTALKSALSDPKSAAAYVDSIQFKTRDSGDREYDELRQQLSQHLLALAAESYGQRENHPRVKVYEARIKSLREQIAAKQRAMIDAQVVSTKTELAAAEARVTDLRSSLSTQQGQVLKQGPEAIKVASLEADVTQMRKQAEALDTRIAEVSANSAAARATDAEIVEWARPGTTPVSPRKGLTLLAFMLGGWVLAAGVALLREWRDPSLRSTAEIAPLLGAPVLAEVPALNNQLSPTIRGQLVQLDPRSPAAGAFRAVRTNLTLGAGRDARTIVVASPTPGDGKSTTASNLAISLANSGYRTLLIDCDLVRPVQHLIFDADDEVGLSSVWAGNTSLREAIQPTAVTNLHLLPCGPIPDQPSDLLTSKRFSLLLEALLGAFDRIVIDSPPLATAAEGQVLAAAAEGTLLVVRMKHSPRDLAHASMCELRRVGANVVGVVANDVAPRNAGGFQRYSYATAGLATTPYADQQLILRRRRRPAGSNGDGAADTAIERRPEPREKEILARIIEPDWSAEPA